jgi:DNA-directed RNA polymerase sigma subunit (sigma70/sigma32)
MIETVNMYRNDKTLREIGIRFRITREAVRQRIVAYEKLTGEKVERHE